MNSKTCSECGAPKAEQPLLPTDSLDERFAAFLSSNEAPDDTLLASLQASTSQTDALISQIDLQITYFLNRLTNLQLQRRRLEDNQELQKAVLSPLRRVPMEVLAAIFRLSLPIGQPFGTYTMGVRWSTLDAPWVFTHVSRSWRAAALGTPTLWNRISCSPVLNRGRSISAIYPLEMLETQLARVGMTTPLLVAFCGMNSIFFDDEQAQYLLELLKLIVSRAEQWEEACLGLTPNVPAVLNGVRGRLGSLQRLCLSVTQEDVSSLGSVDFLRDAPALVDAVVEGNCSAFAFSIDKTPFVPVNQLTRYDMTCSWTAHALLLAQTGPQLVEARILLPSTEIFASWPADWQPERISESSIIRLPALHRLHLSNLDILGCVVAPALTHISLEPYSYASGRKIVESLLVRSCIGSLVDVHVAGEFALIAIPEVLRRMNSLQELRISSTTHHSPQALQTLLVELTVKPEATSEVLGPQLRGIHLIGMHKSVITGFYGDILQMLNSRRTRSLTSRVLERATLVSADSSVRLLDVETTDDFDLRAFRGREMTGKFYKAWTFGADWYD
ncbi:hypothetical protein C8F01DRAFT_1125823 [Mycena amicta]|nr:hypothetical protein C8F01DRAFT_1125823 [Mycena amicta]